MLQMERGSAVECVNRSFVRIIIRSSKYLFLSIIFVYYLFIHHILFIFIEVSHHKIVHPYRIKKMPQKWIFLGAIVVGCLSPAFVQAKLEEEGRLVQVFDKVLDESTAKWLHQECLQLPKSHGKEYGFIFPLETDLVDKHSPVEQFLNQLIRELYENSERFYVEYWTRTKWMLVAPHQDMDEEHNRQVLAAGKKQYGRPTTFHHPETGHVLYLDVGSKVRGPTVIWNVTKGGDFAYSEETEMIIVPAVHGRLTRFQGDRLHGVPRPFDVFWTNQRDAGLLEPTEEWIRSVLLFNLWPVGDDHHKPGIILSIATTDAVPVKIKHKSNAFQDWKEVIIEPLPRTADMDPATSKFKIPLMGDEERRGTSDLLARLEAQTSMAQEAFGEESKVTSAMVQAEKPRASFSFMGIEF